MGTGSAVELKGEGRCALTRSSTEEPGAPTPPARLAVLPVLPAGLVHVEHKVAVPGLIFLHEISATTIQLLDPPPLRFGRV